MRRWAISLGGVGLVVIIAIVAATVMSSRAPMARAQVANVGAGGQPQTLSATGVGEVAGSTATQGLTLNIGVQEQVTGTNTQAAAGEVSDKVAAIKAALAGVGVPTANIQTTNFNVGPIFNGPVKAPLMPPNPGPPSLQGFRLDENMQVSVSSPDQALSAMQAALQAGATSVNSFFGKPGGPAASTPPEASVLAPAVTQALDQAKSLAQASAQSAGMTLGSINSVTIQPPQLIFTGPDGAGVWRVQATVSYVITGP